MITEDYCSFEVAKLLKEKGFNEQCRAAYTNYGKLFTTQIQQYITNALCSKGYLWDCTAPTLQMAMKWLREVHNIFICIIPCEVGAGVMDYTCVLYKIDAKNFYFEDLCIQGRAENISEISYEKACEAAIKYCLERLI